MPKRRLPGTIQEKRGRWYVVISVTNPDTGKRTRDWNPRGGLPAREAAEQLQVKLADDFNHDRYQPLLKLTVSELMDRWLPAHRANIATNTYANYCICKVKRVDPYIGRVPVQKCNASTFTTLYQRLLDDGYSRETVRRTYAMLSGAFKWAVREGIIAHSPVVSPGRKLGGPKQTAVRPVKKTWTAQQLAAFLDGTSDSRFWPIWKVAADTGMRRSELAGLLWENVDLDAGMLTVAWVRKDDGKGGLEEDEPKTANSRRTIDLMPATVDALRIWQELQTLERMVCGDGWHHGQDKYCHGHESGHVFTDQVGRPYRCGYLSKMFSKDVAKVKDLPRRTLHDLRHTHTTLLIKSGVPVKVVTERLGHATVAFTQERYMEVTPTMQRAAADAWERIMQP